MENKEKIVKVKSIFPIKDKQHIYANLESFEWNFTKYGFVYLCFNDVKVRMKYIGYSNINGTPVLSLIPYDTKYKLVEDVCKVVETEIYIERDNSEEK